VFIYFFVEMDGKEMSMRLAYVAIAFLGLPDLAASAAVDQGSVSFTNRDMWTLAQKLTDSLRKCRPLRGHPHVVVGLKNATEDLADKARFSDLIHSMIEGKTYARLDTNPPEYEISTKLESKKRKTLLLNEATYTLSAQVSQAEEILCEKSVKITKTSSFIKHDN
jgi:hypothetical protein